MQYTPMSRLFNDKIPEYCPTNMPSVNLTFVLHCKSELNRIKIFDFMVIAMRLKWASLEDLLKCLYLFILSRSIKIRHFRRLKLAHSWSLDHHHKSRCDVQCPFVLFILRQKNDGCNSNCKERSFPIIYRIGFGLSSRKTFKPMANGR